MKILILILFLTLMIFLVTNLYGQEQQEPNFLSCYSTVAGDLFLAPVFVPYHIDLTDPKTKQFISSFCNYMYEKTGIWIDGIVKNQELIIAHIQDFRDNYPLDQLSDSLRLMMHGK